MSALVGSPEPQAIDHFALAVRAHVPLAESEGPKRWRPPPEPSEWVLVFDTETTTDPSQRLRFGSYQWRRGEKQEQSGLFYDPTALTTAEVRTLTRFARRHGLELMMVDTFVKTIFLRLAYDLRAQIVGFNLPFDLSRIAIDHRTARRRPMQPGFSFQLMPTRGWPRVQVRHLSRRASMMRFTVPPRQRTPRLIRKHSSTPARRGFFVDVKTIAASLTSRSDTLASLAEFLKVPSRKMATNEHGARLTPDYIAYAVNDTQVTWECFAELSNRYARHQLTQTPMYRIISEAGIGKAYLAEMGISPWRVAQPDFPSEIIDIIMQSYFGGRSEVHLRCIASLVAYCDFLSMYPTVCTLMGLWCWVIAKGISYRESTEEARALLNGLTLSDLRKPNTWRNLAILVQVSPAADILPARTQYGVEQQYTIGLNRLNSDTPLWYTLADCINSKIQTGKAPLIVRALTFEFGPMQRGLKPIAIAGNEQFRVAPRQDDFFRRVIELRASVKARMKGCDHAQLEILDSQQLALKILANSTAYGIFMEMNVEQLSEPTAALRYGENGGQFQISIDQFERPGRYFHPLLGTLITGAARLMLGIAERLAIDRGLDWAFCDTDSMAFAKPTLMENAQFYRRVRQIRGWFEKLNPYDGAGELLKLEDANFGLNNGRATDQLEPLFVYAVSSKRYALFNIDAAGHPVIRKASAHGLGHLIAPYGADAAPTTIPAPSLKPKDIGVERWQYDVWYRIVEAALNGYPDQPCLADLPGFDKPAASRYAATTPDLLAWFDSWNAARDRGPRVGPFNFLTAFQARRPPAINWEAADEPTAPIRPKKRTRKGDDLPRPIAPFQSDPARAAEQCFDRVTGEPIPTDWLKTYAEALAQYHLHPEAKFRNADYLDSGPTVRRHIHVTGTRAIGKEANRWEEQFYLGYDPETQIEYGMGDDSVVAARARICEAARVHGQRRLAGAAGVSRERLRLFMAGKATLRAKTIARLLSAISALAGSVDD